MINSIYEILYGALLFFLGVRYQNWRKNRETAYKWTCTVDWCTFVAKSNKSQVMLDIAEIHMGTHSLLDGRE